jgi:ComF family protein
MPGLPDLVCALEYRYPVDMLVRHLKYRGQLQLAPLLAHQLKIALEAHPSQPLLQRRGLRLAFVPQSRERLRERGFNQAEEITRRLSGSTGIPLLAGGPKRNRATPHQAGPGRDGRQRNLAGAFHCAGPLQGQTIALVDDVITTGATLGAVAATLLAAGAKQVLPWVVARTPPPDFAPMR